MPFSFSKLEIADIHYIYGFADGNSAEASREYRRRFPNRRHPHPSVFVSIHRRIIDQGLNNINENLNHNNNQRQINRRRRILREFDRDPTTSIRRVSGTTRISSTSIHRILKSDHRHPYHLQPVQGMQPGDQERRVTFCRRILNLININRHFLNNVLWTDESCFTRRGVVNFHNQHVWAHEHPHATRSRNFQYEFSVNVWIGIYNNHLFGPYFLPPRVNAAVFLEFLETEHGNMWEDIPLNQRRRAWFQLDGCPAHYARMVRDWLDNHYPERWIGRDGPVAWPPRSPDLNVLDFFVWGYLKEKVYVTPVATRDELINRIQDACTEIRPYLNNIPHSVIRRYELCIEKNGSYFEHFL